MAKLKDKFYNRVIEGDLELGAEDTIAPEAVANAIAGGDVANAKPIYWHTIRIQRYYSDPDIAANQCNCYLIILNNQETLMTKEQVMSIMKKQGFYAVLHSGVVSYSATTKYNQAISISYTGVSNGFTFNYYSDNFGEVLTTGVYNFNEVTIEDLGVNKIN